MRIRQAVILAAGLGTRLQPLTNITPKPLIEIRGKPLLAYHIALLRQHGIEDIYVKTFYRNDLFEEFVQQPGYDDIKIIFEDDRTLGTAGFLWRYSNLLDDEFLVTYGDNLTTINYTRFLEYVSNKLVDFGMAVFRSRNLADKSRVEFDDDDHVREFVEKPKENTPNVGFANAGIYFVRKKALEEICFRGMEYDFGHDLIPALLGHGRVIKVYKMEETLIDIGTPESLAQAEQFVREYGGEFV